MESRAPFERERDALLENVSQALEQVITNMAHLNRNLETINTIGKDFDNVASLWREFHTAIVTDSNASNGNEEHNT
ncbi:Dolichyl-diphosphooligosaccharide-protein glycosyltransferase subunit dad1 [Umbelopsis nana]